MHTVEQGEAIESDDGSDVEYEANSNIREVNSDLVTVLAIDLNRFRIILEWRKYDGIPWYRI